MTQLRGVDPVRRIESPEEPATSANTGDTAAPPPSLPEATDVVDAPVESTAPVRRGTAELQALTETDAGAGLRVATEQAATHLTHTVGRGESIERIINDTYAGLDLTPAKRDRLTRVIVDMNRAHHPSIRPDLIQPGWELRMPGVQSAAQLIGSRAPAVDERPIEHTIGRGETPLGIIADTYRVTTGDGERPLNRAERQAILELTAEINPGKSRIQRGLVRLGETIDLPSPPLASERLGVSVNGHVSAAPPALARPPDIAAEAREDGRVGAGREYVVARDDNYTRIARAQYGGVAEDGSVRPLTNRESVALVDLLQRQNPSVPAHIMALDSVLMLPSEAEAERRLGFPVRFRTEAAPDRMGRQQLLEALSEPAIDAMRETGVPASVLIAHAVVASGWGRSMPEGSNDYYASGHSGSIAAAVEDHARMLTTVPAYRAAVDQYQRDHDVERLVRALQEAGYASSPDHAANVLDVIRDQGLVRYDALARVPTPVSPPRPDSIGEAPDVEDPPVVIAPADVSAWIAAARAAKTFLPNEPVTNATRFPFPPWVDIGDFMIANGLAGPDGRPKSELTGIIGDGYAGGRLRNQPAPVPGSTESEFLIVHETVGGPPNYSRYRSGEESTRVVNLFIGRTPGDDYLAVDFETSRTGTKSNSRRVAAGADSLPGQGFVSVELRSPVSEQANMYTESQYQALARAYIMASYRAGEMLTVVPHREVDRGIPDGHGDPRGFRWDHFYGLVNQMLGMPPGTTYGYQASRDAGGGDRNLMTHTNTFPANIYGPVV